MTGPPQLWVFAGPNGAGETTLVQDRRVTDRLPVINADVIASGTDPALQGPTALMLKAGKIAAAERRRLLRAGQSFAMETTLAGHSEPRVLSEARAAGFKITSVYVGLKNAFAALVRVRVARGGHNVPADIVLRQYGSSLGNLPEAMRLADRAFILENSGGRHRLLLSLHDGRIRHLSRNVPDWLTAVLDQSALNAVDPDQA